MTRHEKALEYAVKYLLTNFKEKISVIYVYGSFARGEHKYNSDIDLLVYLENPTDSKTIKAMKSGVNSNDYTLPEVELNTQVKGAVLSSRQFRENIERDKVLIWEKS